MSCAVYNIKQRLALKDYLIFQGQSLFKIIFMSTLTINKFLHYKNSTS